MAELTEKQRRAIVALLESKSVAEASKRSGVGARTIERWKTEPVFRAEYIEASGRCLDDASADFERLDRKRSTPYGRRFRLRQRKFASERRRSFSTGLSRSRSTTWRAVWKCSKRLKRAGRD